MEIKDIMYVALWAGLAIYCIVSARKLSPILYIFGGFFVFMFAWYLINGLSPLNLFSGVYNIVFRVVCGVFLIAAVAGYFFVKRKNEK